jgi:flagellin-like hook-associated protein FlgL
MVSSLTIGVTTYAAGTVLTGDIDLAQGTTIDVAQNGSFTFPQGTIFSAGTTLPTGTTISEGNTIEAGKTLPAGTILSEGTTLPVGTVLPDGTKLEKDTIIPKGSTLEAGMFIPSGTEVNGVTATNATVKLEINPNSNELDLRADISDGTRIDYNVTVGEVFIYEGVNLLDEISKISKLMHTLATVEDVEIVEATKEQLLGEAKDNLDLLANHAIDERTSLGVRATTAENIRNLNEDNIVNMSAVRSMDQDVDYVSDFISLQSAYLIYQASIKAGTQLMQPTILDYI